MSVEVRLAKDDELERAVALIAGLIRQSGGAATDVTPGGLATLAARMRAEGAAHSVFVAIADGTRLVAAATVAESFALFAGGKYGVINEMVVENLSRRRGIGGRLIAEIAAEGARRGWKRLNVTALRSDDEWVASRRFYEGQGFAFAGPQLMLEL